ncbi:MAG TPA: UrcA family protein [Caulobacteraceae bacterium]
MTADLTAAARRTGVALAALAAGFTFAATPLAAQPAADRDDGANVAGVAVYGPHRYVRQPTTGAQVRLDSVSQVVSLTDVDLSTRDGALEAKRRIDHAARDVCQQVQDIYPHDGDTERGCYTEAVRDALAQTEAAAGYPIVAWGYH